MKQAAHPDVAESHPVCRRPDENWEVDSEGTPLPSAATLVS